MASDSRVAGPAGAALARRSKPLHPIIGDVLDELRIAQEKRRQEEKALAQRLAVLERSHQRRQERTAVSQTAHLQQQMLDLMRCPSVLSKVAPATARGPATTTALAASLEGFVKRPLTARAPPPPSLLLTPRMATTPRTLAGN